MSAPLRRAGRAMGIFANRVLGKLGLRLVRAADGGALAQQPQIGLPPQRVVRTEIEDALHAARTRFSDRRVALLIDAGQDDTALRGILGPDDQLLICTDGARPEDLLPPLAQTVFVYACNLDDVGLPFVRHITAGGGVFLAAPGYQIARWSHIDTAARTVSRAEYLRQNAEGFDKFDLGDGDFLALMQLIRATRDLPGAYVEIGCYRGSSGCAALAYMRAAGITRACHFIDVFSGFDYDAAGSSADALWSGTHDTEGPDTVRARLREAAGEPLQRDVVVTRANIITDPLPDGTDRIAMANIDVDMYEAVLVALQKVAPRLVQGGVIVAEDAGHTPACIGARLALEEFLTSPAAAGLLPIYLETGQTALVRTHPAAH